MTGSNPCHVFLHGIERLCHERSLILKNCLIEILCDCGEGHCQPDLACGQCLR